MKNNLGTIDRILRLLVGLVLIALVFTGPQINWGWIGLIPLATALVGNCPVYSLLGFSTCSTKKQND